jgi:hypothetical protein
MRLPWQAQGDETVPGVWKKIAPRKFHLGDKVEITGMSNCDTRMRVGECFIISEILTRAEGQFFSSCNVGWYPASSLRLVETLKVGDWVQVIDCPARLTKRYNFGKIGRITACVCGEYDVLDWRYEREALRKLTPEEIASLKVECDAAVDDLTEKIRVAMAPIIDARLEEIEKANHRLDETLTELAGHIDRRFSVISNRLSLLEAAPQEEHARSDCERFRLVDKCLALQEAAHKADNSKKAELEAKRLSILRQIAYSMRRLTKFQMVDICIESANLDELDQIEKQLEGL